MEQAFLPSPTSYWSILTVVFLRYLFIALAAFLVFYVFRKNVQRHIQKRFPAKADYYREIGYSVLTSFIFAGVGYLVFGTEFRNYTQVYTRISDYGILYFILSIGLMLLLHDTYFYWTHYLMHHKRFYRYVHKVHHLSTNPSPWAALAFHPFEAVVEAGIVVVIAMVMPAHPIAIGLFLLVMMFINVYGHLGYELYPAGFSKTRIGRWINTSVNHNMHHQYARSNYGLYFLFWDRWMNTLHPDYDQRFEQATTRKEKR